MLSGYPFAASSYPQGSADPDLKGFAGGFIVEELQTVVALLAAPRCSLPSNIRDIHFTSFAFAAVKCYGSAFTT